MFFAPSRISFPADLASALEQALRVGPQITQHGQALRQLWPKLAKGRGQILAGETHYSFQKAEAEAYAAYYLPVNSLKVPLVLEESFLLGMDPLPSGETNWLDLGTGPGTAFWGLAWWCAQRGKKLRFTGWDQSPAFARIAGALTASRPFGATAEFLAGKDDPLTLIRQRRPTHVSFVNSLAEIFPDSEQRWLEIQKILQALRELERADGKLRFLLLLEPGSRESSRELAALKDRLPADPVGHVILPCLDARTCGALANPHDWCHEEVGCEFPDWVNELGAQAGLRKESLLFSYAWIESGAGRPGALAGGMRMVSQRMERKGQVECRLCTAQGKRMVRVQRSKATEANEEFFRCSRGDLWRNAEIGEKGDLVRAEIFRAGAVSVFS